MPLLFVVNLRTRGFRAARIRPADRHCPRLAIGRQRDAGHSSLLTALLGGAHNRVIIVKDSI